MLVFYTAGESHGRGVFAFLDGLPAGLKVDRGVIDADLARRQHGYGRGGRMAIEKDRVDVLSGIRGASRSGARSCWRSGTRTTRTGTGTWTPGR